MIQHIWTITLILAISFMLTAFVGTIDFEGQCTSQHNCHLVNDLGMTEYLTYTGFTNAYTIPLMVMAIFSMTIGAVVENFRDAKKK